MLARFLGVLPDAFCAFTNLCISCNWLLSCTFALPIDNRESLYKEGAISTLWFCKVWILAIKVCEAMYREAAVPVLVIKNLDLTETHCKRPMVELLHNIMLT